MGLSSLLTCAFLIVASVSARHVGPSQPNHFRRFHGPGPHNVGPPPRRPTEVVTFGNVDCSLPHNQVTLHPHPTSCTLFLQCDHGRTVERPCAPGTEFSPSIGVCVHPWQSDCTAESEPENPSEEDDELPEEPAPVEPEAPEEANTEETETENPVGPEESSAPEEVDTEKPESANPGGPEEPAGDPETEEPGVTTDFPTSEGVTEASLDAFGICDSESSRNFLAADPSDCSSYVLCVSGVASVRSCNSGEHFDAAASRCLPGSC